MKCKEECMKKMHDEMHEAANVLLCELFDLGENSNLKWRRNDY